MRTVVLTLLLLLAAAPRAWAGSEVVVTAKLTGISMAPKCGDMHTATVMRYEVAKVHRGPYAAKLVYAVFDCGWVPGQPGGVRIGDVHKLTLKPIPSDFSAAITDDFAGDTSAPRLLAVRADPP